MKKYDIFETVIESVNFPNKGVANVDGIKVITHGGLPGQRVMVKIIKKRRDKIEGEIIEVLEKSPIEIAPKCEHFDLCGGCTYQHLPYEEQLKLKESQVKRLLEQGHIADFEFEGIEHSPSETAYRNKMEYSFGDVCKGGELALGQHRKRGFYEVVTVSGCQIVDEDFNKILVTVNDYFKDKGLPFHNKKSHIGVLRHLVVRKAHFTGEVLVNLVTSTQQEVDAKGLFEKLKEIKLKGKLVGFLHTLNDGLSDVVKSDETRIIWGQDYMTEELLGLKFKISAFSFFQTNSAGAEKLYSIVRDFAGSAKDKIVYDLYCGTGTIAQIMAPMAKKVAGIELVEEAVVAAKENASLNGLNNCEFIAGDVLKKIDELTEKPDIIILDPPRDGVHPKALEKIINYGCKELVYVSCKPTSLVRDLQVLQESGYKVEKVRCMDMFPGTPHVETVVRMERK